MGNDRPATVGQLITSPTLSDAILLAGSDGLDAEVLDIDLRTRIDKSSVPRAGDAIVLDASAIGEHQYQIDVAIRVCADASVAALIVTNHSFEIGLGAQRLANRFGLPLLSVIDTDALGLTHRLRERLWAADVEQAALIDNLLSALGAMRVTSIEDVTTLISELSAAPVAVLDRDRTLIAGTPIEVGDRRLATRSAHGTDLSSPAALHSTAIVLASDQDIAYWLIGETSGSDSAQRLLRTLLQIGSWYLTALIASVRVSAESDARRRIAVLNEILDTSDLVERDIQQQLRELGWSAAGWNTGLHIKLRGADAARIVELHSELRERLREAGLDGPLVERNDGWSGWVSDPTEPAVETYSELVHKIGEVLQTFVSAHSGLVAHGGIGRPHPDLDGLRVSLTEAHEAAVIANARSGDRSGAAHIDQLGMQRVLMGWFSSEDFARYARSILEPILALDPDHELLRTLEAYLDSSCSTTDAAHQLSVHRNTVANRISKVTDVLDVRLEDPETRLSLQLACRVLRINR
ncbi:MAG: hypothetical protein GY939_11775 [Actinomycetia bacterium]|nr:hypothetical protein [Actinomycetes bacterium]